MKSFVLRTIGIGLAVILFLVALLNCKIVMASTNGANVAAFSDFSSTSYILMDFYSGKTLVQFNDREKMPIASICKLMTSLITLEKIEAGEISLEDKFLVSEHAASVEGSQAFLDAGSEYTVAELLKSVVVASANDSAIVLAEGICGSEESFVKLMNNRAKELGMLDTNYTNATGLTTPNQYSTAYDTCLVLREINKYPKYSEFAKIWMDNLTHPSGRVTELVNTNRLIKYYPYCLDGKTGFTDEAGYCLSSIAQKDNLKLVAVALNCKDAGSRFTESMQLYDYGFASFVNNIVLSAGEFEKKIDTNLAKIYSCVLSLDKDLAFVCEKTKASDVQIKYDLPDSITAPKKAGDVVGTVQAIVNGEVVDSSNIVLMQDIEKQGLWDVFNKIFVNWPL